MHWTRRNKLKDLYHLVLLPYRKHKVLEYPVKIKYTFTWKTRALDTLNCAFIAKMLEDGMKGYIITDDDIRYVTETILRCQKGLKDEVLIEIFKD